MNFRDLSKTHVLVLLAIMLTAAILVSFFAIRFKFGFGLEPWLQTSNITETSVQYTKEGLVAYALLLINSDRQASNVANVTLSSVASAQQHAEDMLRNDYFSHWDANGYKPYVRYTLAGGKGAVNENIAVQSGSSIDPKVAIKDLEWNMLNDDAESNWGHKANILNAFHNKVNIGIAYNAHCLYLVQDFEDDYVNWTNLTTSNGEAFFSGTFNAPGLTVEQVDIYYDGLLNLTTTDLNNAPYNSSYGPGTYVGSVAGSKLILSEGVFVTPQVWDESSRAFRISFALNTFLSKFGTGIYTLRLWSGNGECLTSHSIFLSAKI